jgi:ribosomal 30S subunit maturation factor RimM
VKGERELLLPAHGGVVRSVDLAERLVTVDLPAGIEEI